MRKVLSALLVVVGLGCADSHVVGDSDARVGTDGGVRDSGSRDSGPRSDAGECLGFPAPCHADLGGGCCGRPVMPDCVRGIWICPPSTIGPEECRSFEPCGMPRCEGFTEIGCLNQPGCTPVYDDACCPLCDPVGFCADCTDIEFERCAPIDVACSGRDCGMVPRWTCGGARPDCSDAFPNGDGAHCSMPGCVKVSEPGCDEDDCTFCAPVGPGMCTALCPALPPDCGPGRIAQGDGMCFTGLCVYAELCAPPG